MTNSKNKRLFTLFAVLFVAIFAVGCVFNAACGKKKKEEEEPETPPATATHEHDYVVADDAVWTWSSDHTSCTATATCTNTDGECDALTTTVEAKVEKSGTEATCTEDGETVYTATYGTKTVGTYTEKTAALGHDLTAVAAKASTCTETGYEAYWTCSRCNKMFSDEAGENEITGVVTTPALAHTYPDPDGENASDYIEWGWASRTATTVKLTLSCEECGTAFYTEDVVYTENGNTLTASTTVENYTYTGTYEVPATETHEHSYVITSWNWDEATYTCTTATATCQSVVGTCDQQTMTVNVTVTSATTKEATCTESGEVTYTATADGYSETSTKTQTTAALGHDWQIDAESWEWDFTNEPAATVNFDCSRCNETQTVTATVTSNGNVYTATVKGPDGNTYTDTYKYVNYTITHTVDFNAEDTYADFIAFTDEKAKDDGTMEYYVPNDTYTTGILSYTVTDQYKSKMLSIEFESGNVNAMALGGASSSTTLFFTVDLAEYIGENVKIEVDMSSNVSAEKAEERSLYVSTKAGKPSDKTDYILGDGATSSYQTDVQTLVYEAEITDANKVLCLIASGNICIFSITISLTGDKDPWATEGEEENPDNPDNPDNPGVDPEEAIIDTWVGTVVFSLEANLGSLGTIDGLFVGDVKIVVQNSSYYGNVFSLTISGIEGYDAAGKTAVGLLEILGMGNLLGGEIEVFSYWDWSYDSENGCYVVVADDEGDTEFTIPIYMYTVEGKDYLSLTFEAELTLSGLSFGLGIDDQSVKREGDEAVVRAFEIGENTIELDEGTSRDVAITIKTTDGSEYSEYTFSYSADGIANASVEEGVMTITAISAGEVTITVTAGTFSDTITVTVNAATVCGVEFENVEGGIVTTGETSNTLSGAPAFKATYTNGTTVEQADYTQGDATWTSSDQTVATVEAGVVTLLSAGVTKITVEINGYSASYVLVVGYAEMSEDDDLTGEWTGGIEFTFETGISTKTPHNATGTAMAEVAADAVSLTFDVLVDGTVYSGNTFAVWTDVTLYKAGNAYYVIDADGGDITAITLADGILSTTVTYKMTIKYNNQTYANSTSVTETFNLSLYKPAESRVEAATTGTTLTDTATSATATFENDNTLTVAATKNGNGEVEYELTGTASTMTAEQAYVFWNGVAAAHDAYVVITIKLEEGETLYWLSSDGSTKSIAWNDSSEVVDGCVSMVIRLSGALPEDGTVSITERTYYIVGADNTYVTHVVSLSGVTIPERDTLHTHADPDAEGYNADANIYWDWDSIDDRSQTSGSVDVYILCTECGAWVKYTTNYSVDQNDETSFTASVEAGGHTYTGTQKMEVSVSTTDELNAALEKGGLIALENEVTGTVDVNEGVTATLDLAGKTITAGSQGEDTVTVAEGATLTITDSGEGGAIVNEYTGASSDNNAQAIYSQGTVILDGGTVEAESVGIRADAGKVIINDGTISAGYTGIWMSRGEVTVTVNGGAIECTQKAIYVGGDGDFGESGIFHPGAVTTLNVYDGEIKSEQNSAIVTLGTCNTESAIINIYGGEITSAADTLRKNSETDGNPMPAVYVPSGTLNISETTDSVPVITGSTAVEIRGGMTTISGGVFNVLDDLQYAQNHAYETSNATTYGYALAVFPYGSGVKNNGSVIDNTVNVQVTGGVFNGDVFGSTEADHTKTTYSWAEYTFEISGGTFKANPSAYVATGYKAHEITDEEAENCGWYTVDEAQTELAIIGSTSTDQGPEVVTVTTGAGSVTAKCVTTTTVTGDAEEETTVTTETGPNYKTNNKVEINNVEYNPVKQESSTSIEIATTTACTVTIVCRGKYNSASGDSAESWNNPSFTISGVTFTTKYDEEANLWYYSFEAEANQTYSLNRAAEDLIYAVAFTY